MEIVLVVAVILLVVFMWLRKRNAKKAKAAVSGVGEQANPLTVAPKPASKRMDTASKQTELSGAESVEKIGKPAEIQSPAQTKPAPAAIKQQEQIPEDSTLRRHYLSTRQAEKQAVSHPYPTDSTLRRHYESMQVLSLKPVAAAANAQNPAQPANKWSLPEDSALRRHVLTQVRTEIEARLSPRPTDSTLRRHYDSQVEAKMEEYLAQFVA